MNDLNKTPMRRYWQRLLADDLDHEGLRRLLTGCDQGVPLPPDACRELFLKYVATVNIETSVYCNRVCSYCPVADDQQRKIQGHMAPELFEAIIDQLESVSFASTLCLNLYNEPLSDDHIFEVVAYARQRLPSSWLMFNSNGDYITPEVLDHLKEVGLSMVAITLHPSPARGYDTGDRRLAMERFLDKQGAGETTIERGAYHDSLVANLDWEGMRCQVMANNWAEYGNSRAGALHPLKTKADRVTPCVRPMREFTIACTGEVYPCCQFYPGSELSTPHLIGKVGETSIFELYASQRLAAWRRSMFTHGEKLSPCDTCLDPDFSDPESATRRAELVAGISQ